MSESGALGVLIWADVAALAAMLAVCSWRPGTSLRAGQRDQDRPSEERSGPDAQTRFDRSRDHRRGNGRPGPRAIRPDTEL